MADLSTAFIPMIDLDSTNTPNACGMERKIQIFKSFAEADEADKKILSFVNSSTTNSDIVNAARSV